MLLIKLTKIKHKESILKAAREKQQVKYKGNPIYLMIFQQKLCRPERGGRIYLKYWKGKIYNQDYSTLQGISIRIDEEIKSFSDKQKLREFHTNEPTLQQMLKRLI